MENFTQLIALINDNYLGYVLIAALVGSGVYFTFATRFVQFVRPKEMLHLILGSNDVPKGQGHISPFQAFAISTASRVGTGNIAGVALAISIGGPGAIFWMWLIAVFGAASAFAESTLAQVYKVRSGTHFRGGPAYYIRTALKNRTLARVFSIGLVATFPFAFSSVQANTIAQSMQTTFHMAPALSGLIIAGLTALIIFGGLKRIATFSAIIVPVFAIGYIAVTLLIMLLNFTQIPHVLWMIVSDAFSWQKLMAGTLGGTIMMGARRGLFSNEAGMGSTPNAAATAHTSHPVKQGLVQAFGVFVDTLLICSCTAFIILLSNYTQFAGLEGIALTQAALTHEIGSIGNYFLSASVLLFAFTSIIGNYYYGQANVEFLSRRRWVMLTFRVLVSVVIFLGAIIQLDLAWGMADLCMTFIAVINIYAILRLSKEVLWVLADYRHQKRKGKDPVFHISNVIANAPQVADPTVWN
ncbi:MAG: alanine:cation symporter family protein [Elusimicrobiaceae bacterium]|nr:alanine:cation symporter family protein [Elusimicrobiaceae bacterium]MBP5616250.1 alanine:cation symporter family protein [Elusimicrobiaceae bacterium]